MAAAARVLESAMLGMRWSPFSASSCCYGYSTLLFRCQWPRLYSAGSRLSMNLRAGIVGLPNVGKSTLFNAVVSSPFIPMYRILLYLPSLSLSGATFVIEEQSKVKKSSILNHNCE